MIIVFSAGFLLLFLDLSTFFLLLADLFALSIPLLEYPFASNSFVMLSTSLAFPSAPSVT